MELTSNRVFALIESNNNYAHAVPITKADNVLFVEDYGLNCEVDAILNETTELDDSIRTLINTSLKGGQTTLMLSCIGHNTYSSRRNTLQLFFDCLESTIEPKVELEYVYLSFSDNHFHDFRKNKNRPNRDLYENGLSHFAIPAPSINTIKEAVEIKLAYPFMIQIRFKNKMNGSITLMDMMNTSYKQSETRSSGLTNSFHKLRDALALSVNQNYNGVVSTEATALTYAMQDFIAGTSQNLTIVFFNEYADSDRINVEKAFAFIRNCRKLKSRILFNSGKATEKLYTNYKTLKENYDQLKDHYYESRRRHQDMISKYNTESLIRQLNSNTAKVNQLFQQEEVNKLRSEQFQFSEREHDLKMEIVKLKMDIVKLKAERDQEKALKEDVWRDASLLETKSIDLEKKCNNLKKKCSDLEKTLSKQREQTMLMKDANDELMDLRQKEMKTTNQYGSIELENKYLKDMVDMLKASLKNANEDNAKLEDRIAQFRMGVIPEMWSFGHSNRVNTSYREDLNELQYKYDKLQADFDQKMRANAEQLQAMKLKPMTVPEYKMMPSETPRMREFPMEVEKREVSPKETPRREESPKEVPQKQTPPVEPPQKEAPQSKTPQKKAGRRGRPKKIQPKEDPQREESPKETSTKENVPPPSAPIEIIEQHDNNNSNQGNTAPEIPQVEENIIHSNSPKDQLDNAFCVNLDDDDDDMNPTTDAQILPNLSPTFIANDLINDLNKRSRNSNTPELNSGKMPEEEMPEKSSQNSQIVQSISDDEEEKPEKSSQKANQSQIIQTIIDDDDEPVQKKVDDTTPIFNEQKSDDNDMSMVLGDDLNKEEDNKELGASVVEKGDKEEINPFDPESRIITTPRRKEIKNKLFDFSRKTHIATSSIATSPLAKPVNTPRVTELSDDDFQESPELPPRKTGPKKMAPGVQSYLKGFYDDNDSTDEEPEPPKKRGTSRRGRGGKQVDKGKQVDRGEEPKPIRPNKKRKLNMKKSNTAHLFLPNAKSPLSELLGRSGPSK